MRRRKESYVYTCSVCGKEIKKPISIVIDQTFNLGEDGYAQGTTEWHICKTARYHDSCIDKFISHIEEKFEGQDIW